MSAVKKAALITGASSGIGKATAIEFAKNGYFVYLMGRNKSQLEETALYCRAGASILSCDLLQKEAVQKRVQEALSNPLTQLEVLVNNAGIFHQKSQLETSEDIWNQQYQTNLLAPVMLTQMILPAFLKNKKGSIVNVSSTLGIKPTGSTSAYSAMKAALNNWTLSLAQEFGPHGIRANAVCPGIIDTPIHGFHSADSESKAKILESMGPLQPLGRIGTPEEVAKAIFFLGSDNSNWTTGSLLNVDGGINIQ